MNSPPSPGRIASARSLMLALVFAVAGCGSPSSPAPTQPSAGPAPSEPTPWVVVRSLGELTTALPPVVLRGVVVARGAALSQWGGDRLLLRLADGEFVEIPDTETNRANVGTEVSLIGWVSSTLQARSRLEPVSGEEVGPAVAVTLEQAEPCTTERCPDEPVSDRHGLRQAVMRSAVTVEGRLKAGTTPDGETAHVLEIEGAFLRIGVVAEGMAALGPLVGKSLRATGTMRLESDPQYFVTFDGTSYPLQGGWFLSHPALTALE